MAPGVVLRVHNRVTSSAGRWVAVRSGPFVHRYLHLSRIGVERGDHVDAGDLIGRAGRSGIGISAPHLHTDLSTDDQELARDLAGGLYKAVWGPYYYVPMEPFLDGGVILRRALARLEARGIEAEGLRAAPFRHT
jgi:murein DD-endopeptidase MepM/ murein hydrolase activator NlpD